MTVQPGRSRGIKWTARLSLAGGTLIAASASYLHTLLPVQVADGHTLVSYFIPALADLLIAAGLANVLDARRCGESLPPWSAVAIGTGIVVTVAMNLAATWPNAMPPWCVNVWPPLAFLLSIESLVGHVRRGRDGGAASAVPATGIQCPHGPARTAEDVVRLVHAHAAGCEDHPLSQRDLAAITVPSRPKVAELVRPSMNGHAPNPEPEVAQ